MSSPPPPTRYARPLFLAISAVTLAAVVIVARSILLPFLLAVLTAYVLFPLVARVERLRIPRWVAILGVYALTIGAMAAFSWAVIPRLFAETKNLSTELPRLTQQVSEEWLPALDRKLGTWAQLEPEPPPPVAPVVEPGRSAPIVIRPREDGSFEVDVREGLRLAQEGDGSWAVVQAPSTEPSGFSTTRAFSQAFERAIAYAQDNTVELLALGQAIVAGISRGVFYFFLTLMLAGYMMLTYERILAFVRDMWPDYRRAAFDRFVRRLDRGMGGVVRGQLLICLVNGVLSAIGFWLFGLKYWPILSLIAAILSIIPIFGSIISSIPAVAIGLTQSLGTALGVLAWIIGIHQVEANFLNPKIIGDQAKIHPVLVVFALLLGEHYFQITGALLAVPCLSIAQTVFLHFRESVLGLPPPSAAGASIPPGEAPDSARTPDPLEPERPSQRSA